MTEPLKWNGHIADSAARRWRVWLEDDDSFSLTVGEAILDDVGAILAGRLDTEDEAKQLAQRLQDVLDGVHETDKLLSENTKLRELLLSYQIENTRLVESLTEAEFAARGM